MGVQAPGLVTGLQIGLLHWAAGRLRRKRGPWCSARAHVSPHDLYTETQPSLQTCFPEESGLFIGKWLSTPSCSAPAVGEWRRRAGGPVSCLGPGVGLGTGGGGLRSSQTDVSIQRVGKERRQERGTIFSTRRRDSLASARCTTAPCVRCTAAWRSAERAPGCFPPCQLPPRGGACAAQTGVHTPDCSAADLAEGSGRLRGPLRPPVGSRRTLVGPGSLAPVCRAVALGPGCVLFR